MDKEKKLRCSKCGELKSTSEFSKDETKTRSYQIYCKKCFNKYKKIYYQKHKAELMRKQRDYRKRLTKEIEDKLGIQCSVCGEKGKSRRIYYHEIHGKPHLPSNLAYILNHIDDFVPLCFKCHSVLHTLYNLEENVERLFKLLKKLKRVKR